MTAAVVTLAIALAGALVAIALLVRALLSGLKSERASFASEVLAGKAQVAAELAQRHAERTRDEALAAQAKAEAERDAAKAELAETVEVLDVSLKEKADATIAAIRTAPTVTHAYGALVELFARVPGRKAVPVVPAGGDHGDPG